LRSKCNRAHLAIDSRPRIKKELIGIAYTNVNNGLPLSRPRAFRLRLGTFLRHTQLARILFVIGLMLASVGLWEVAWRSFPRPASGTLRFDQPPTTRPYSLPVSLKIATFNMHSGYGADGKFDLQRTASILKVFDLVWLNEVHGGWPDQTVELSKLTTLAGLFVPTERRWLRDSFGNGLLSRLPEVQWVRLPLESHTPGYRNALLSVVPMGGTKVTFLQTHLTRGADRRAQLRAIATIFQSLAEPAVLMGDLNTTRDDPELSSLLGSLGVTDAIAQVVDDPHPRIDWIITRGLRVRDAGVVDVGASDHPLYWAEIEPGVSR